MKILKNAGTFEILVTPDNVIEDISNAARTCYQSQERSDITSNIKLIRNLIKRKHMAMIEFADMTVRFNFISRGFTHEQVRHRLTSIGQESTRYVDESEFQVVVPPHKNEEEKFELVMPDGKVSRYFSLKDWFKLNEQMYRALRKAKWKPEDARQVLPIGIKSQIVIKANLREWRHIFHMRCDRFAHWEIRGVMLQLLNNCKKNIPIIFDDFLFYSQLNKEMEVEYFTNLKAKDIVDKELYAKNY